MSHDHDVVPDSTYPPLEPPGEFKSQIPEHLLKGASETDRYIMAQMSIMRQYSDWSVKALLSQSKDIRLTNGKVRRAGQDIEDLKADRKNVKIGWKVISGIVGGIAAVVTFVLMVYQAFKG